MSYLFYIALFIFILLRLSRWIKQQYMATLEEVTEEMSSEDTSKRAPTSDPNEYLEHSSEAPRRSSAELEDPSLFALPEEVLREALQSTEEASDYHQDEKEPQLDADALQQSVHSMLHHVPTLRTAFILGEILRPKHEDNNSSRHY